MRYDEQGFINQKGQPTRTEIAKKLHHHKARIPSKHFIQQVAIHSALQASGKFIPWQVVTISTDGRILD